MATAPAQTTVQGGLLERRFKLAERGTTPRREALGGATTFLTMSYILFVNPAILSAAGIPFTAVALATALSAAIFTALMALVGNVPFALAPGLGINAIVAFELILGQQVAWPVGMAAVFIEGVLAIVLVLLGLREAVMRALPTSLKLSIGVGIGLFITLVGLREGGIVVNDPATGIALGDLSGGAPLIALAGLAVGALLAVRDFKGALLTGVAVSTAAGLVFGVLDGPEKVADVPAGSDFGTIGDALDPSNLADALAVGIIPIIFALFMTDFFDSLGTVVGLGKSADLLDERDELPGIRNVLLVDSLAAAGGGAMGASSVTTYVESGAGINEGARTGLSSLVVASLFLVAILFIPLLAVVGGGVQVAEDTFIHPAIAPALILVGFLMLRLVALIEWDKPEVALPAFAIIAGVPLTFSIAAGIGFGVLAFVGVMVAKGRASEVSPLAYVLVPLFVLYFASDWITANV